MKANDFIKKFGLDLAKRDIAAFDSGFIKRKDFLEHYGFDILDDLKRLVESHELVEKLGGLSNCKKLIIDYGKSESADHLSYHVANVESCQ